MPFSWQAFHFFSSVSSSSWAITSVINPIVVLQPQKWSHKLSFLLFCFPKQMLFIHYNYIPPRISKVVISFVVFQGCHWPNPHGRAWPVWRPGDGLALAVATRLGVKFGTVVEMRVRSNAPVCFDDVGDWSSLQAGRSSRGGSGRIQR